MESIIPDAVDAWNRGHTTDLLRIGGSRAHTGHSPVAQQVRIPESSRAGGAPGKGKEKRVGEKIKPRFLLNSMAHAKGRRCPYSARAACGEINRGGGSGEAGKEGGREGKRERGERNPQAGNCGLGPASPGQGCLGPTRPGQPQGATRRRGAGHVAWLDMQCSPTRWRESQRDSKVWGNHKKSSALG
jgi:hypothetical protein